MRERQRRQRPWMPGWRVGRPHDVEIIFNRSIRRDTTGTFRTAIDRRDSGGAVVNAFYKHSRIKQYLKAGRAMRIETVRWPIRANAAACDGLVVVLTATVCAVAAGARSFVAIAEWVAGVPVEVASVLGIDRRRPSESTIRRLVSRIDADRFDAVLGGFVQRLSSDVIGAVAPASAASAVRRWQVLAVDGKTLRGSRSVAAAQTPRPARHLLAVIDQHTRVVLGQVEVAQETNEISAFTPLIQTLTGIDLTRVVITADALHTQRGHLEDLHATGAHRVLTAKANQPGCAASWPTRPRRGLDPDHRNAQTSHDRREIRTLTVLAIAAGLEFPHARHAIRITRKTRPASARDGTTDQWRTETVYAITYLGPHQTRPDELAAWIRLDPRALADREQPAPGTRRDLHRGPSPRPHRRPAPGHGPTAKPRDQPAPARRGQHRQETTTSQPQRPPTTTITQDHLTLPAP